MKEKPQQSFLVSLLVVILFIVAIFVLLDYAEQNKIEIAEDVSSDNSYVEVEVQESQQASAPGGIFILTGETE